VQRSYTCCIKVADCACTGRTFFLRAFFSDIKVVDYAKHKEGNRKRYLNAIEAHLKGSDLSRRGPFVIGNEISYADFVLYQLLHDENLVQDGRKGLQGYERLVKLVDAVEERPNIKMFLNSADYLG
jgi:prostaglandin-H2 D-isomerase / glutathione transferase